MYCSLEMCTFVNAFLLLTLPSQESGHPHSSGLGRSGQRPLAEDTHQHGAACSEGLEAVNPWPSTQGALWRPRLQDH